MKILLTGGRGISVRLWYPDCSIGAIYRSFWIFALHWKGASSKGLFWIGQT